MTSNLSWSDLDIENMRASQEAHMMDSGYRYVYSRTLDTFGDEVVSYTKEAAPTICGLEYLSGNENHGSDMTVVTYEAVLRLPFGFILDAKDRFEIVSFRGETVSWMYEVAAPIQQGVSGLQVPVNRVEI